MEKAVFSKKEFMESINKDRIMSECLRSMVELDEKYCKSAQNAFDRKTERIQADVTEKKRKRNVLRTLTEEQKRQVQEMKTLSVAEKEKIIQELQRKLQTLEERVESFLREQERQVEQLKCAHSFSPLEALSFQTEASGKIPPALFRSAVKSMEEFHIKKIKDASQYLKQCEVGKIRHNCSENGITEFQKLYPDAVDRGFLQVPYVIGRDHGIYQMFFYKDKDRDMAWQHFQTLCLAEILLHEKKGYHLTVVMEPKDDWNWEQFLNRPKDEGKKQYAKMLRPKDFSGFLNELIEVYKRTDKEKFSYEGIAFWDFPCGLTQEDLRSIYDHYNFLEEYGVFFLFMVNDDSDKQNSANADMVYEELYSLMKELPAAVYNREKQGYEANGSPEYVYLLEEYRNL